LKKSYYREISEERVEEFFQKGYPKRYFFPHKIYYLPKCGPGALKLSHRMCGKATLINSGKCCCMPTSPVIDEFPEELFYDDDLIWHQ
jgi:hypothetical protein